VGCHEKGKIQVFDHFKIKECHQEIGNTKPKDIKTSTLLKVEKGCCYV
jgi:hypothetical protein